ncbi:MAG: LLM class flavin-dependent oxidoreductase [Actinomycetota bacterium]|nr:LLM class flavin-dependent oxidoreductase [Actinomycetota bacterium]
MTTLGAIFPPNLPPERLRPVALAAEAAGLEQLWVWEDCFYESGIAVATAVLAWTERLVVGIGLLPVPLRNVALTAMEIATVDRLFPGRLVPGVGHGVLDWMGQVGVRAESPMTLLREYATALRALLHGETVSMDGRYVHLDSVALDWPPKTAPPLLIGAVREKTMALAGAVGDGVILSGDTTVESLRAAVPHVIAGRGDAHRHRRLEVVVFLVVEGDPIAADVAAEVSALAAAGATHVMLHSGGGGPALEDFVRFVAEDVRRLVR